MPDFLATLTSLVQQASPEEIFNLLVAKFLSSRGIFPRLCKRCLDPAQRTDGLQELRERLGNLLPPLPDAPDGVSFEIAGDDIDVTLLAQAADCLLLSGNRTIDGAYLTPTWLVDQMVAKSLIQLGSPPRAVLDPACGSGIFLLRTAQKLSAKGISRADVLRRLYAIDRSESAVRTCRLLTSLWSLERTQLELVDPQLPDLSSQIVCGNTLIEPSAVGALDMERAKRLGAFSFESHFPLLKENGGFDLVIGNPPYGLSREDRLSPEENALLKQAYHDCRSGKVNKYMLFMARGFSLLSPQGSLAYIVPNSWLGIDGASAVREKLLSAKAVCALDVFRYPVFPELSVETVAVYLNKAKPHNSIQIRLIDRDTEERYALPVRECREGRISTSWSPSVRKVLARIEDQRIRLGDPSSHFRPLIALQAYAVGKGIPPQTEADVNKHVFHSDRKLNDSYFPYLEGQDIKPFRVNWSKTFLRYGPCLAEPQELGRFQGPRIVVREILGSGSRILSAAVISDTYLYNKSVLHILPKTQAACDELAVLCAILNSKVIAFVIQQLGRKSQRKLFPKVVLADLQDLPLPAHPTPQLVELALQLALHYDEKIHASLDTLVYEAYGLRPEDRDIIEQSLLRKR